MSLSPKRSACPAENTPIQPIYVYSPWQNKSILDVTMGDGDRSPEWGVVHRFSETHSVTSKIVSPNSQFPVQLHPHASARNVDFEPDPSVLKTLSSITPRHGPQSPAETTSHELKSDTPESLELLGKSSIASSAMPFHCPENDTFIQNERLTETSGLNSENDLIPPVSKIQLNVTANDVSQPAPKSGLFLEFFSPLSSLVETFRNRLNLKERYDSPKFGSYLAEKTAGPVTAVLPQHSNDNSHLQLPSTDVQTHSLNTDADMIFFSPVFESHSTVTDTGCHDNEVMVDSDTNYSSVLSPSLMGQSVYRNHDSAAHSATARYPSPPQFSGESISWLPASPCYSTSNIEVISDRHSSENCVHSQLAINNDAETINEDPLSDSGSLGIVDQQTLSIEHGNATSPNELHSSPLAHYSQPHPAGRRYTYIKKSLSAIDADEGPSGLVNKPHSYPQVDVIVPTNVGNIYSSSYLSASPTQPYNPVTTGQSSVVLNSSSTSDSNSLNVSPNKSVVTLPIDNSTAVICGLPNVECQNHQPSSSAEVILLSNQVADVCRASDNVPPPTLQSPSADYRRIEEQSTSAMLAPSPNDDSTSDRYHHSSLTRQPLTLQNSLLNPEDTSDIMGMSVSPKPTTSGSSYVKPDSTSSAGLGYILDDQTNSSDLVTTVVTTSVDFGLDQLMPGENKENISIAMASPCRSDDLHSLRSSIDVAASYKDRHSNSNEANRADSTFEAQPSETNCKDDVFDIPTMRNEIASLRETYNLMCTTIDAYENTLAEGQAEERERQTAGMQAILQIVRERDEAVDQVNTMRKALDDMVRRNKRAVDTIVTYRGCQSKAQITLQKYVDRCDKNAARCTQAVEDYTDRLSKALAVQDTQSDTNQRQLDKTQLKLKQHQCRIVHLNEQIKQEDHQREELQRMTDRLFNGPSPLRM